MEVKKAVVEGVGEVRGAEKSVAIVTRLLEYSLLLVVVLKPEASHSQTHTHTHTHIRTYK